MRPPAPAFVVQMQRLGSHARTWRIAAALGFVALIALAIRLGQDPGITTDDIVQRAYGDLVLDWYRSGFRDRGALSYINLYLYGGLFDLAAQWLISTGLPPWGRYETRHVLSALVAVAGIGATWLSARRIAGSRAGFCAAALLTLTPAWVGHGLFNSKDIPFGTGAAFVMYASVRVAMRTPPLAWSDALWTGVALGLALGVRSGGMFLAAYPLMAAALRGALHVHELRRLGRPLASIDRVAAVSLGRAVCAVPVAWLIMLSAWPWAQIEPWTRPFHAARFAAHFDWHGRMRFDGATISDWNIPPWYLPRWFQVTLPDVYALALACGLLAVFAAFRGRRLARPRAVATGLLASYVLIPLTAVVVTKPTIYDGHRHFLFLLPFLAVLGGLAFEHVWVNSQLPTAARAGVAVLAAALGALTLHDMAALHPYEYVYFNRASGGLAEQATRFETDYWGASYREGFEWIVRNYDPGGKRRIGVKTCTSDKLLGYYRKAWAAERFYVAPNKRSTELFLAVTKRDCHKRPGEVIHRIERQGVPLLYVIRTPR